MCTGGLVSALGTLQTWACAHGCCLHCVWQHRRTFDQGLTIGSLFSSSSGASSAGAPA